MSKFRIAVLVGFLSTLTGCAAFSTSLDFESEGIQGEEGKSLTEVIKESGTKLLENLKVED